MKHIGMVVLAAVFAAVAHAGEAIRIGGSDALGAKLVPRLCEAYRLRHPDTLFTVTAEGSSTAFTGLAAKALDIGMSHREPTKEEAGRLKKAGVDLERLAAASDTYLILVHSSSSLTDLTLEQVEAIFCGDVTDWAALGRDAGPIRVFTRNTASGTFAEFKRIALRGRPYSETAMRVSASDQPHQRVGDDPNGITYAGHVYRKEPGIKALTIGGRGATDPSYPYRRRLFYYVNAEAGISVKDFVTWATRSTEAAKIVSETGFLLDTSE